jgi:uncharacterized protein YndB with AHSA1/START domain
MVLAKLTPGMKTANSEAMKHNEEPIVVEQMMDATAEAVWDAITQVDQMRRWYFDNIPSFKPEVGFETRFVIHNEDRKFPHVWTVTDVVPMKLISYDWRYEGYAGDSFVTFELSSHENLTKVRLTHQVRESFTADIPEFTRESGVAGWKYFINDRLRAFLKADT